jgi:hypothetical protein
MWNFFSNFGDLGEWIMSLRIQFVVLYACLMLVSIMSIIRTIYRLHGLPPNNLYDATANDLNDMFTERPDFSPYFAVPSYPRVKAVFPPDRSNKKTGNPMVARFLLDR